MTADDEALVRSFYEIVTSGDQERLITLLDPEWEMIPTAYPDQPAGAAGYLPLMLGFNRALPDGRFTIHEIIAAPPKYIVRTTAHGTHKGEFLGIAATDRPVSFNTIDIHEVVDNRLRRSWHIEDFANFHQSSEDMSLAHIVILRPLPTSTFESIGAVLPRKEKVLWRYLANGECRSISYDEAVPGGVVLEFETPTLDRVKEPVAAFPLVSEGLHQPEYHPLAPYTGLAVLFDPDLGFAPTLPRAWADQRRA